MLKIYSSSLKLSTRALTFAHKARPKRSFVFRCLSSFPEEEERLLRSAMSFLQHPPTDPTAREQDVRFTPEQLSQMIGDISRASGNECQAHVEEQIAEFADAKDQTGGCVLTLGQVLALLDGPRSGAQQVHQDGAASGGDDDEEYTLGAAFARLDADGDDRVDLSELQLSLRSNGASEQDARLLLSRFDRNGDGVLSKEEYERMVSTLLVDESTPDSLRGWSRELADYPELLQRSQAWMDRQVAEQIAAVPEQEEPILLLPYGPPGSGKSGATTEALRLHGIRQEDCIEPNIDEFVRSYMREVTRNEELFGDQETYHATRAGWPARATVKLMEAAQLTRRHMIVETTGRSKWLVEHVVRPAAQKHGVRTVLVYVLVPLAKIAPRALARKIKTGQGHPPFSELSQTCVKAARHLADFEAAGGEKARVLFADNAGPVGSLKMLEPGDTDLLRLARDEPFFLEEAAMLTRQARGRPYCAKALADDGLRA